MKSTVPFLRDEVIEGEAEMLLAEWRQPIANTDGLPAAAAPTTDHTIPANRHLVGRDAAAPRERMIVVDSFRPRRLS